MKDLLLSAKSFDLFGFPAYTPLDGVVWKWRAMGKIMGHALDPLEDTAFIV